MFTRGYVVFKMFDPSATGTTWPHRSQLLKAPHGTGENLIAWQRSASAVVATKNTLV